MKLKEFIGFVFCACCLLPGISLAQDKVVVIPLMSDSSDEIPTVTSAGQVWMDRNLGAFEVAQSADDYRAYGWRYQWGRLADGHEVCSNTTTVLSTGDVPGHGTFILNIIGYDWRLTQNDNLWQGESGTNNPCPAGFRVPTETEWETERASWSSDNSAGAFASPLKLVVAGYRNYGHGEVGSNGSDGLYWSSTVSGSSSRYLQFSSSGAQMMNGYRASGFSVRCIKD